MLLNRGVDKVYPSKEELENVLRSGKKLRLYQGFDPTGTQFHIGHMVGLRKLAQFQELGHEVFFLIGDGTGQAGDPSGKKTAREKFFTREELKKNALDYVRQAGKIVRFDGENAVKVVFNGDWLNRLGLVDLLTIAQNFSVQQFIERDMYQERIKKGESINLREFMYPLLQAYDSVAMEVDLEIGGTDQTFNMLAGRTLVKTMLKKDKFVMTLPLLADSKGVKIGKSEGNVIGITDKPEDLFGKMMSLGDDAIIPCFTLLTDNPMEEVDGMKAKMVGGDNPMLYKRMLARQIVRELCGDGEIEKAEKHFDDTVVNKTPDDVAEMKVKFEKIGSDQLAGLLVGAGLVASKSEFRRLMEQGGVYVDEKRLEDKKDIVIGKGVIVRVGKRRYVRLVFQISR